MIVFYLALLALAAVGATATARGFQRAECLGRSTTDSLKGVFILLVFLSHFFSYIPHTSPLDAAGYAVHHWLLQLVVVYFMFCSGYGVREAIGKKGSAYLRAFPANRLGKTLLHMDIAVVLFCVMNLALGRSYSLKTVLLSFVCWTSVGNSNWYIFAVLMLYLFTWIAFSLLREKPVWAAAAVTGLTILYILVLQWIRPMETWWYDTVLCYCLGIWVSLYREKLLDFVTKNNLRYLLVCAVTLALFLTAHALRYLLAVECVSTMLFALLLVLFSLKVAVHNPILQWCGGHVFEIFILQRIPMIVLREVGLADWNRYVYFVLCFALTLLLSVGFRALTDLIDRFLFPRKKAA